MYFLQAVYFGIIFFISLPLSWLSFLVYIKLCLQITYKENYHQLGRFIALITQLVHKPFIYPRLLDRLKLHTQIYKKIVLKAFFKFFDQHFLFYFFSYKITLIYDNCNTFLMYHWQKKMYFFLHLPIPTKKDKGCLLTRST